MKQLSAWRAEARELDWRPGGSSLIVMHGPDGEEVPNDGTVLTFEPNKRFVLTDAFTGDWRPEGPFMVGVFEIEADGDSTLYRASARHWTREAMDQHQKMGFEGGAGTQQRISSRQSRKQLTDSKAERPLWRSRASSV